MLLRLALCSCVFHCAPAFCSISHCAPAFHTGLMRCSESFHTANVCAAVYCALRSRLKNLLTVLQHFTLGSCVSLCAPAFYTVLLSFASEVMHRRACSWRTCMPTDRTTPNIARLSRERMCSSILCSTIASQEPSRFSLYAPAFYTALCSCVSDGAHAFRSVLLRFVLCSCVSHCAPTFRTVLLRFAL